MSSKQRMDMTKVDKGIYKGMMGLQKYVEDSSLSKGFIALIEVRVSQINHCAFCLDMHNKQGRKAGVDQRKLDTVAAFREAHDIFDAREKAALAFAEEVTLISQGGVSDETWNELKEQFSDQEIVELLATVNAINAWNRMAIATLQDLPEE